MGQGFTQPLRLARTLGIPHPMKILFLGDVVGRSGRTAIIEQLGKLREDWKLDFVVVNGENASNGAGLTSAHAKALLDAGADVLTLGDHSFDQKDMIQFCEAEPRIIRPLNFSKSAPGKGAKVFEASRGRKVLVAQALGQVFMKRPFDDPFSALDTVLKAHPMGGTVNASLIDIHCEATSEKMAVGHFCDGRASIVVGTHTHVPTSDTMILPGGTAFQSDAGMCGDYNSVIGMDKTEPLRRFITGMPKGRFEPANGEATLSGIYVETDDRTGKATRVEAVRQGGRLSQQGPAGLSS
jgi:metallophosphoesterase (TIGR00282 family)